MKAAFAGWRKRERLVYGDAGRMTYIIVFIIITGLYGYLFGQPFLAILADARENITYDMWPSADRAFAIAEHHFSDQYPSAYNIDRAADFFRETERRDPGLKYVHHELARIAFLKGDFTTAMAEINLQIAQEGDSTPNSYYVRGLIEGFAGNYGDAAKDYEYFLQFEPRNWAGINDYAWVLLKASRSRDAVKTTAQGLVDFPDNAWLLNSNAIALYEVGDRVLAKVQAQKALVAVGDLTEREWSLSYPGNDPKSATEGLAAFKKATINNMSVIIGTSSRSAVQ